MSQVIDWSFASISVSQVKAAGYTGFIRYLSGGTSKKDLTAAQVHDGHALGLDVGAVWETTAGGALLPGAGDSIGQKANAQLDRLGAPDDMAYYIAFDTDLTVAQYAQAVAVCQKASTYGRRAGPYGEYGLIEAAAAAGVWPRWQTTAWSGGRHSAHAQLYQRVGGSAIPSSDVNDVLTPEWGQWHAAPAPTPPLPQPQPEDDEMLLLNVTGAPPIPPDFPGGGFLALHTGASIVGLSSVDTYAELVKQGVKVVTTPYPQLLRMVKALELAPTGELEHGQT